MNVFWQKFAWTVLGLGTAAIAQLLLRGGIAEPLFMAAAGGMVGGAWMQRPGDMPAPKPEVTP